MSGPGKKLFLATAVLAVAAVLTAVYFRRAEPPKPTSAPATAVPTQPVSTRPADRLAEKVRQWRDRAPGQAKRMLHSFNLAVAELHADPRRHLAAGDRALAVGQNKLALDCYRRARALGGDDPDILKGLAIALVANQRLDEAGEIYRQILQMEPNNVEAAFNRAVVLSQLGLYTEAEEAYRQLLNRHPDYFRAQYNLASLCQVQGKLHDARDAWAGLLANPEKLDKADAAAAWYAYGETLLDLKDGKTAMNAFAQVTNLQPENVGAWMNLAVASRLAGDYGHAVLAAKRAAKIAPFDAQIWSQIGETWLGLYQATGKEEFLKEALDAWKISLNLDPTQPQIRNDLKLYDAPKK